MLTLAQLEDHVSMAIGRSPDGRSTGKDIVNEAGQYLFSMHEWMWASRPSVVVTAASNLSYAELPLDFGTPTGIEVTDALTIDVHMTTMQHVLELRANTLIAVFDYWVAVVFPSQVDRSSPPPPPRLEMWPTPTADRTFNVSYRARFIPLVDQDDVANVPPHMETLLIELVRAVAKGRHTQSSVTKELGEIEGGVWLHQLKDNDGMTQPNIGTVHGGIVPMELEGVWRPFSTISGHDV